MTRDRVLAVVRSTGHSRFPFTSSAELDDVSGVVLAKELLYWLLKNPGTDIDWQKLRREPLIVPASTPVTQLLRTFQEARRHLAIVVDEYGTLEGIVTLEDVMEEIVGEIDDESDRPSDDLSEQDDGRLLVAGSVDLRRLSAQLGVPWNPESEAATISGLVTELLERIPAVGDSLEWNGFRIEVVKAGRRRVKLLAISKANG
jgi:CBS domain containing-hemolysin-like protein